MSSPGRVKAGAATGTREVYPRDVLAGVLRSALVPGRYSLEAKS